MLSVALAASVFLLVGNTSAATDLEDLPDSLRKIKWASLIDQGFLVIPDGTKIPWTNDVKPKNRLTERTEFSLGLDDDDETEASSLVAHLCSTASGREGLCRRVQYCPRDEYVESIDIFLRNACLIGEFYIGVCCPDQSEELMRQLNPFRQSTPSTPVPAADATSSQPSTTTTRPTTTQSTTQPAISTLSIGSCGLRDAISKRILGGEPAEEGDWPWMAALFKFKTRHICGGALITDRHVLTAAHCLYESEARDITVRLAEHDLQEISVFERNFSVSEIFRHENYSRSTQANDIAILTLDQRASLSKQIFPVCLPDSDVVLDDRIAFVTGWGTSSFGGKFSPILHQATLPMWTKADCVRAYPKRITNLHVCAGHPTGRRDACQGDSGGPLNFETADKWVVVGIVSWGKGCGERGQPGVYTRVAAYIEWILSKLAT